MGDWSSYALTDFLMFTPATYFRQYELVNAALWPWQLVLQFTALAAMWIALRTGRGRLDGSLLLLAPAWLASAWWFLHRQYAPINLAADPAAWLFALQAGMLLAASLSGRRPSACRIGRCLPGLMLFVYALVVHPLLGPLMGHGWSSIEVFGVAPDPTALATLAVVLTLDARPALWLAPVPLAWTVFSGLTHLAMDLAYGLVVPAAAMLAIALRIVSARMTRGAAA